MRYVSSLSNPMLNLAYATHPGRTGKNNEDDYVFFEAQADRSSPVAVLQVAAVADGIGGNMGGEMASHLAAQSFHDTFRAHSDTPLRRRLLEAIEGANREIYERSMVDIQLQGMGTTIVAVALSGDQLHVVHAGDSRAYLIRKGHAHQLTLDHTWAQEAIDAGRLTPEQAREHPNRHVIKRFLGIAPTVELDSTLLNLTGNRTEGPLSLQAGDTILLCSDGLTDVVSEAQIEQMVNRYPAQDAANRLIDLANKAGGPDNITVLMVQLRDPNTPVSKPSNRAGLIGLGLLLVLALLAGGIWYWINNRNAQPNTETTATPTVAAVAVAAQDTATPLPAADTPTVPPPTETATALPSDTPFTTATPDTPYTSTPLPEQSAGNSDATVVQQSETIAAEITRSASSVSTIEAMSKPAETAKPPTSTPLPDLPTNTATPTLTATATNTPTPPATDTRQPTATLRASPTAKATTAAQAAPIAPTNPPPVQPPPTLNPVVASPSLSVQLSAPADGEVVNGRRSFAWQINGALPVGMAFEPVFCGPNEDIFTAGQGFGGTTTGAELTIDLTAKLQDGTYKWGVLLVGTNPYTRINLLSNQQTVRVERPGGGGNQGGGQPVEPPPAQPVENPP